MEITWDNLLERIKENPPEHVGGYSPAFLYHYFEGYSMGLAFHRKGEIEGEFGLYDFNQWFISNAYAGPQGWASYCLLLTATDDEALDLFFEFRRIAMASDWKVERPLPAGTDKPISILELIQSDVLRKRPAMFFGNTDWVPGIWAMWNGYIWAEKDIGVSGSSDSDLFVGFQDWLRERFAFAQDANFGKVFQFLALDVQEKALENFFDHLELFIDGGAPDANTKRFQSFLDNAVASALKERERSK